MKQNEVSLLSYHQKRGEIKWNNHQMDRLTSGNICHAKTT